MSEITELEAPRQAAPARPSLRHRLAAWLKAECAGLASYPEPGDTRGWDWPEDIWPSPAAPRGKQ